MADRNKEETKFWMWVMAAKKKNLVVLHYCMAQDALMVEIRPHPHAWG
jgi:hypothetical protein